MKLCTMCYPNMSEHINKTSKVISVLALDHENCQNCGFSNNDMKEANFERLRATDINDDNYDSFVKEQCEKTKQTVFNWSIEESF
jgi:hypothetical protein